MRAWLVLLVAACGSRDPEPAASKPPAGSNAPSAAGADANPAPAGSGSAAAPVRVTRRVVQLTTVDLYDSRELCALLDDGKLRCWGSDAATPVEIATPARFVTIVDDQAIDEAGTLWERVGTAAAGTVSWRRDPSFTGKVRGHVKHSRGFFAMVEAAIVDGRVAVRANERDLLPPANAERGDPREREHPVTGIANATAVALAAERSYHGCAVDDATVKCWRHPELVAAAVTPGSTVIAVGDRHMCTLHESKVKCWNNTIASPRIETMPGLDGATSLASEEIDAGHKRLCGVLADGAVRCTVLSELWLGHEKPPVATPLVGNLPPATGLVLGATSCAILRDGNVTCWGANARGEVGDGTLVDRPTPTAVKHLLDDKPPHPPATGAGTEPQASVEMDWIGLPAKCTRSTTIADVAIVCAYAKGKAIRLASYRLDASLFGVRPRGAQRAIDIDLERRNRDGDALPLVPARYPYSKGALQAAEVHLIGASMKRPLVQHGGAVELTLVDPTWICGAIVRDNQRDAFAARRLDGKP